MKPKTIRILIIKEQRSKNGLDGTATYLKKVAEILKIKKIYFKIIYNKNDDFYKSLKKEYNTKLINFHPYSLSNSLNFPKKNKIKSEILRICLEDKINLICVHSEGVLDFLERKWNIPVVLHYHGAHNLSLKLKFKNLLDLFSPRKIPISLFNFFNKLTSFNKIKIVITDSIDGEKTFRLMHGKNVNIKTIPGNLIFQNKIKNKFKLNKKIKKIICHGRLVKDKGLEDFCKLAEKLKDKNFKFLWLGSPDNDQYFTKIKNQYARYVSFLGFQKNVGNYLQKSDLYLFLSKRESMPFSLIEALEFNLPILCWNVVGVRCLIKNNINGYIFKKGSLKSVEKKILDLKNDINAFNTIRKKIYKSNKKNYNNQKNLLINFYKKQIV